jgi:capsular polysaccharide biosynthesis protein
VSTALLVLRRRWLLIATLVAAAAAAVAAYSFTAADHYKATATLVVSPVAASDPTFLGIDVLREGRRRTAADTAATLLRSPAVAEAARVRLGLRRSAADLLDDVSTHVIGGSDAVALTATDTSPARAAQIANAFVDAFVSSRTSAFQSEVASTVARLQKRLAAMPRAERTGPAGAQLQRRLADTRALVGMRDPTVSTGSEAVQPRSPSWPKPVRWTIYAALVGLGVGCLLAVALGLGGALRRRESLAPDADDAAATERVLGRFERSLSERLDTLAEEQTRLAAREAELEVRERELAGKLDELRTTAAGEPRPDPAAVDQLERREQTLGARIAAVEERERELARRSAEHGRAQSGLSEQEDAAREREAELEAREQDLAARDADLRALEERLAAERAATSEREAELETRADDLRAAERRISDERAASAEREAELTERAARLAVQPPPVLPAPPAHARPAEPAPAAAGGWALEELERLVERESRTQPERVDEWRSYLFYLRDYADASGRVPARFDWLIEETFGDLLARR